MLRLTPVEPAAAAAAAAEVAVAATHRNCILSTAHCADPDADIRTILTNRLACHKPITKCGNSVLQSPAAASNGTIFSLGVYGAAELTHQLVQRCMTTQRNSPTHRNPQHINYKNGSNILQFIKCMIGRARPLAVLYTTWGAKIPSSNTKVTVLFCSAWSDGDVAFWRAIEA